MKINCVSKIKIEIWISNNNSFENTTPIEKKIEYEKPKKEKYRIFTIFYVCMYGLLHMVQSVRRFLRYKIIIIKIIIIIHKFKSPNTELLSFLKIMSILFLIILQNWGFSPNFLLKKKLKSVTRKLSLLVI